MARVVGLRVNVPIETPAVTINRLCGSGFEAIVEGARVSNFIQFKRGDDLYYTRT